MFEFIGLFLKVIFCITSMESRPTEILKPTTFESESLTPENTTTQNKIILENKRFSNNSDTEKLIMLESLHNEALEDKQFSALRPSILKKIKGIGPCNSKNCKHPLKKEDMPRAPAIIRRFKFGKTPPQSHDVLASLPESYNKKKSEEKMNIYRLNEKGKKDEDWPTEYEYEDEDQGQDDEEEEETDAGITDAPPPPQDVGPFIKRLNQRKDVLPTHNGFGNKPNSNQNVTSKGNVNGRVRIIKLTDPPKTHRYFKVYKYPMPDFSHFKPKIPKKQVTPWAIQSVPVYRYSSTLPQTPGIQVSFSGHHQKKKYGENISIHQLGETGGNSKDLPTESELENEDYDDRATEEDPGDVQIEIYITEAPDDDDYDEDGNDDDDEAPEGGPEDGKNEFYITDAPPQHYVDGPFITKLYQHKEGFPVQKDFGNGTTSKQNINSTKNLNGRVRILKLTDSPKYHRYHKVYNHSTLDFTHLKPKTPKKQLKPLPTQSMAKYGLSVTPLQSLDLLASIPGYHKKNKSQEKISIPQLSESGGKANDWPAEDEYEDENEDYTAPEGDPDDEDIATYITDAPPQPQDDGPFIKKSYQHKDVFPKHHNVGNGPSSKQVVTPKENLNGRVRIIKLTKSPKTHRYHKVYKQPTPNFAHFKPNIPKNQLNPYPTIRMYGYSATPLQSLDLLASFPGYHPKKKSGEKTIYQLNGGVGKVEDLPSEYEYEDDDQDDKAPEGDPGDEEVEVVYISDDSPKPYDDISFTTKLYPEKEAVRLHQGFENGLTSKQNDAFTDNLNNRIRVTRFTKSSKAQLYHKVPKHPTPKFSHFKPKIPKKHLKPFYTQSVIQNDYTATYDFENEHSLPVTRGYEQSSLSQLPLSKKNKSDRIFHYPIRNSFKPGVRDKIVDIPHSYSDAKNMTEIINGHSNALDTDHLEEINTVENDTDHKLKRPNLKIDYDIDYMEHADVEYDEPYDPHPTTDKNDEDWYAVYIDYTDDTTQSSTIKTVTPKIMPQGFTRVSSPTRGSLTRDSPTGVSVTDTVLGEMATNEHTATENTTSNVLFPFSIHIPQKKNITRYPNPYSNGTLYNYYDCVSLDTGTIQTPIHVTFHLSVVFFVSKHNWLWYELLN